jgi:hypothetical protein
MEQLASQETKKMDHAIAWFARFFLLTVAKPTTHLIGLFGGKTCDGAKTKVPLVYRLVSPLARLVNWGAQGAITLSHPKMAYNPVAWHKKRLASQWASLITGISEEELDAQARQYIREQQSITPSATESDSATFTILIGFHTHLHFFQECINSVAAAASKAPEVFLEVLIVNDDPSIHSSRLDQIVEKTELQSLIRSNHANLGICRSINETLPHAKGEWIIYLDCDDRLHPDAIVVLQKTIRSHPGIRFISSRAVDLDESGRIFAYRLRDETPVDLIQNNYASHLKAIRRDLHHDIGGFHPMFEGCQDFELAVRTALFERLLFIPDYLYQYRWHDRSQTVGNCDHQNEMMIRVRQTYLLAIHWLIHGINGVAITCTGKQASQWAKKIPDNPGIHSRSVQLEADSFFTPHLYKLWVITLATEVVFAKSTNQQGSLPSMTV